MFEEPPSIRVVKKIATLEGVDPVEITPPLYDAINPDALDSLFHSTDDHAAESIGTIEFTYFGYTVVVDSTGAIDVTETDPALESSFQNVDGSIGR